MRCEQEVFRNGKVVVCGGIILDFETPIGNRIERDSVCMDCSHRTSLAQDVVRVGAQAVEPRDAHP